MKSADSVGMTPDTLLETVAFKQDKFVQKMEALKAGKA